MAKFVTALPAVTFILSFASTSSWATASRPNPARVKVHSHLNVDGHMKASRKDMCGDWDVEYAQLHKEIRAGDRPPRYLVNTPRGGLADELSCMGSAFYFALLTERAFLIREQDDSAHFSAAYVSPFIDWQYNSDTISTLTSFRIPNFRTDGHPLEGPFFDVFRWGNLSTLGEDAEVVFIDHCNAGITVELFDNPLYKTRLFGMGLRPAIAYGCMFKFLFKTSPAVQAMFAEEAAIMTNDSIMKIGIQIRTGDDALTYPNMREPSIEDAFAEIEKYESHFACAQHIENISKRGSIWQDVIWFLLSDSIFVRKSATVVYGSKILTNTKNNMTLKHIIKEIGGGGPLIMMHTAGEHWLYSLSDYFVFGSGGFGRSSALSSLKWGLYNVQDFGCKPVGIENLHSMMPGIK